MIALDTRNTSKTNYGKQTTAQFSSTQLLRAEDNKSGIMDKPVIHIKHKTIIHMKWLIPKANMKSPLLVYKHSVLA